jgi:hypothetical protein
VPVEKLPEAWRKTIAAACRIASSGKTSPPTKVEAHADGG